MKTKKYSIAPLDAKDRINLKPVVCYPIDELKENPVDDKYYRLLYKIPDLLDPITYVKRYPDINNELIGLNENTLEYNEVIWSKKS